MKEHNKHDQTRLSLLQTGGKDKRVDMFPWTGKIKMWNDRLFALSSHVECVVLMSSASRRSHNEKSEWEKYGEYFMNRSVSDIMSEYSEQHDEWHWRLWEHINRFLRRVKCSV